MSSRALQVRSLTESDLPQLLPWLPELLPGDWSAAALRDTTYQQRVLLAQGQMVGFAEYYCVVDECHLLGLAISPVRQQQGLGCYLLGQVLREARRAGCTQCLLELRRSNAGAIKLYEKFGFRQVGARRGYYPPAQGQAGEDALLYSADLSEACPESGG